MFLLKILFFAQLLSFSASIDFNFDRHQDWYSMTVDCDDSDDNCFCHEEPENDSESCPIICQWSSWWPIGPCSKSCGGGIQRYTRHKTTKESNGGLCSGTNEKYSPCNIQGCPGKFLIFNKSLTFSFNKEIIYNIRFLISQLQLFAQ